MSVRFAALRTEALTGRASLSLIEKVTEEVSEVYVAAGGGGLVASLASR
jgi:hypothetical protein